ncbi:MAG: Nre family DNA repair protein [Candidatus Hadarchaeales archaeon]
MGSEAGWLSGVLSLPEISRVPQLRVRVPPSGSLCLLCRGGKMLCGKTSCPVIAKARTLVRTTLRITSPEISGSTPPGVFVGRIGYPKVFVGPMVPPFTGDTEILDTPELWGSAGIQDIIDYRFSLIRGKVPLRVTEAAAGNRLLETLQELAMGRRPVEAELSLSRIPRPVITLSDEVQPFGPSAPLRGFQCSQVSPDHRLERAFYDRDLRASEAVLNLYEEGVMVTRIQRAFSLGMFGQLKRRKLVPTRWSITAVDMILSQHLIDRIKESPTIDEYRVYVFRRLDNLYVAMLMPERWSFEWMEAWFPGTAWNPGARSPAIMGDHEGYRGRTSYPDIGGCYYACRLAVAEALEREGRQATALVVREIHPGYTVPVGVWNVRESVRAMMMEKPATFDNLQDALAHMMRNLTIPFRKWVEGSEILRKALFQRKIEEFI